MRRLSQKKKAPARGDADAEDSSPAPKNSKQTPPKKRSQSARKNEESEKVDSETFEVDSIVASRIIRGQTQYKVHWKGYPSSNDTWEFEANLKCDDLVKKFLKESEKNESEENDDKKNGQAKRKGAKGRGRPSKKSKTVDNGKADDSEEDEEDKEEDKDEENEEDQEEAEASTSNKSPAATPKKGVKKAKSESASESSPSSETPTPKKKKKKAEDEEEYEVEQILDSLLDRGKRYFLVRWKGYGKDDDTWEPESNLTSSKDLVEEYLTSHPIDEEREDGKKTRENPRKSSSFAVGPSGKRKSRRSHGRPRATYFDQE